MFSVSHNLLGIAKINGMFFDGLRKKALRKFKWLPLKNEIDVTNDWHRY